MTKEQWASRVAGLDDSDEVARLLHDFNTEFDAPSPGSATLATRLRDLFNEADTFAVLVGEPAVGVGLVTIRPNVWYEGPVALLDELYVAPGTRGQGAGSALLDLVVETCRQRGVDLVEINVDEGDVDAQRFYRRHGFTSTEPDSEERAFYFRMELI
ncbi:MAG TPA: GNAT family N-acetyltransferase [Acidimicrobiia bacterium]|nr:GNAT family N-acetyltransferase [Acidimicrobiia bacterium]